MSTIKHTFSLIGYKLLFSAVAFVFIPSFYYLPLRTFSGVTAVLYLIAAYSYIWKIGKADFKKGKFNLLSAFVPVFISEGIAIILAVLEIFMPNDVTITAFRFFQLVYSGFITDNLSKFLIVIPIFLITPVAYTLGYKKFEIFDRIILKLVYKDKK